MCAMLFKILRFFVIILAYSAWTEAFDCTKSYDSMHQKLEKALVCNYIEFDTRPVKVNTTVTEVDIDFRPVNLDIVKDKDVIKVMGSMDMSWKDEYLTWNKSSYGGIASIQLDVFDVWKPRLTTAKGYGVSWYDFVDELDSCNFKEIEVSFDGVVKAKLIATLYGPCSYDITLWPYDVWSCNITLGKRQDEDGFVVVKFKDAKSMDMSGIKNNNPEWDIKHVSDPAIETLGNDENMELSFILQRHLAPYMGIFIFPAYVVTLVSILPYWLATKTICRLLIHFLCVSIQICLLQYIFFMLENGGSYKLNLISFFTDCFYVNIIGMVITIVSARFITEAQDPPQFIINFLSFLAHVPFFGACFAIFSSNDTKYSSNSVNDDDEGLISFNNKSYNSKWMVFFTFIDHCAFYLSFLYITTRWLLW